MCSSDLKMRKEALDIGKKSTFLYGNLKVLQKVLNFSIKSHLIWAFKDYKSVGNYVTDMTYQARANTKAIEGLGWHFSNQKLRKNIKPRKSYPRAWRYENYARIEYFILDHFQNNKIQQIWYLFVTNSVVTSVPKVVSRESFALAHGDQKFHKRWLTHGLFVNG